MTDCCNYSCSRVDQFVYVPTNESFFSVLDQHADTLECDVKPPLVLVGNEGTSCLSITNIEDLIQTCSCLQSYITGSGKSALLANWASKRLEHKHRDEFLFQHFVGCSTSSLQVFTHQSCSWTNRCEIFVIFLMILCRSCPTLCCALKRRWTTSSSCTTWLCPSQKRILDGVSTGQPVQTSVIREHK